MEKVTFVGDIHSGADDLRTLLTDPVILDSHIVFLGDYIDGLTTRHFSDHTEPMVVDPLAVLDILMDRVAHHGDEALLGNHDDFWLATARRDRDAYETWKLNGGKHTWARLGITGSSLFQVADALNAAPLQGYTEFLNQRPITWENDAILAVHAGVNWHNTLAQQERDDLLWIRGDYYFKDDDHHAEGWHRNDLGKVIVTGHTPVQFLQTNGIGYIKMTASHDDVPRYLIDSGSRSGAVDGGVFALTLAADGQVIQKKRAVKGQLYDGDQPLTEADLAD